ncbi:thioredoxin reductase [Spiroplasma sabaudiense Ar-1343]|uniref:Ferredoxin--NADP reductase n=1 Tax=Spiroplasma sabaudiense Ar-1343 TaxID=1276257 RepID=W6A952_9MOLU|nr:NAD(P)/FAD-dependent oxidoreductase [Spiroplasma sabaudiense]AHI53542.1 thioredoxin reductase [Spiroplasma sabaudiense Ar-1343]
MIKDLLIIGAGATGLYTWKIANSLELSGTIIEANFEVGGQANLAYPEKLIYNLPGISAIQAKDFVQNLLQDAQVETSKINLKTAVSIIEVIAIKVETDFNFHYLVKFSDKTQKTYKSIIICEGLGEYQAVRLTENNWANVHYVVNNKENFENKKVAIFGGGDSAIDWAKTLSQTAKVTLIHRRNEFRSPIDSIKDNVEILTPYEFCEIKKAEDNLIKSITIFNGKSKKEILVDEIIVQFGATIKPHPISGLEVKRNELKKIAVDENMQTSLAGVFAAGDAIFYPTKKRNLIFGFQEAVVGLSRIDLILNNKKIANKGW